MQNSRCLKCGRLLTIDEIGIFRKLVNRGADSFMCLTCLAEHFDVTEAQLRDKIEYYRAQGCVLFQ